MLCIICLETLILRDDVFTAQCGHCLHYGCWRGCINTNQSCPVCRKVTTSQHLIRLYFNGEADDVMEPYTRHITSLTSKVTSLDDQVKAAEKRIANEQTANALLREQLEHCAKRREEATLLLARSVEDLQHAEEEVQSLRRMLTALGCKSEQQLETMKEKLESAKVETSYLQERLLATQEKLQSAVASSLSNKQQLNHLEKIKDNEIAQMKVQFDNLREKLEDTMHKSELMQQQLDANEILSKKAQSQLTQKRNERATGNSLTETHVLQEKLEEAKKRFQALLREVDGSNGRKSQLREVLSVCQGFVVKLESQILPPSQRAGAVERSVSINVHNLEKDFQELYKNFQILKKRLQPCAIP